MPVTADLDDTERLPMIQHISAVTFAVRAMPEALTFYTMLGFTLVYGGPQSAFSTLQAGEALVNLMVTPTIYANVVGPHHFPGRRRGRPVSAGVRAGAHACRSPAECPLGRAVLSPDRSERA